MNLVFHNPAAAIGLAALALPLLIHLLTRRTPLRLRFPTVRFIRSAQANLSALYRVRHRVMLIVRTLLLAAVLAAFLKPFWHGGSVAAAGPGSRRRAVIIVLDASMSMGYSRGGGGPLARGREAARKLIDSLDGDDLCNFVVAAAAPRAVSGEPTDNRFHLRRELAAVAPTLERAEIDAALGEALRQLEPLAGVRKEIHFISDFQRANWTEVKFDRIPAATRRAFISVAEKNPRNLAVTSLTVTPSAPVVGEAVEVTCKVGNFSPQTEAVTLRLALGEEAPIERALELRAGQTVSTSFRVRANEARTYEGTVALAADDLPADDERCFTLQVAERVEALVLTDEMKGDEGASHRFLARALDPLEGGAGGTFRCTLRAPDALGPAELARAQIVFVCGARALSEKAAERLLEWTRAGGSLVWFLGAQDDVRSLELVSRLAGAGATTLPFEPGSPIDYGARGRYALLAEGMFDDPMLRAFREARDLRQIPFRRLYGTRRDREQGEILLRYDDGNVALARQGVEAGTLLLCNFSPRPADGDLVKRALFVPLMHELGRGIRPGGGAWSRHVVGHPCTAWVPFAAGRPLPALKAPSGATIDAVVEPEGESAAVIAPRTTERGLHRVFDGDRLLASIAVNVDSRESDLAALTLEQVQALGGMGGAAVGANVADGRALDRLVEGLPLWQWFLLAGLVLMALEQSLAWLWRR